MSNINNNTTNLENILNDINNIPVIEQSIPSITVSSSGLITASVSEDTGYINGTTTSTTKQLTTQAAKTITPSTSEQTAVASGAYTTGAVKVSAIPSSYVKPTATKTATTWTPKTSNQTIAAGTYCSGAQTIKGDANLVAANIASGKSIFGVSGSYTGTPILLWTNASPTSVFNNQAVSVPSGYNGFFVEYRFSTSTDICGIAYLPFTSETILSGAAGQFPAGGYTQGGCFGRVIWSATSTSITFAKGFYAYSSEYEEYSNGYYSIPTRIWGVKFTL